VTEFLKLFVYTKGKAMVSLSAKFIAAVAQSSIPRYALGARVGVSPAWMTVTMRPSKHYFSQRDRERLTDIAFILGVPPADIFDES